MNKSNANSTVVLVVISFFLWINFAQGQESSAIKIPLPAEVQLQVLESGHPWRPPFGVNRVGRSYDVLVTIQSKELPEGEFRLVEYLDGEKINQQTLHLTNKTPYTGDNHWGSKERYYIANQLFTDAVATAFTSRSTVEGDIDQVELTFVGSRGDMIELARQAVELPAFEAEAIARPDTVINPVDLGAILVPADWLLLKGGQKAHLTVAALIRNSSISNISITAWYNSAPENKATKLVLLNQRDKVQIELALPECSKNLKNDMLQVSIKDDVNQELWSKQIQVMIVPKQPDWPVFGAVKTKLRFDNPILNMVNGINEPINYDEAWPEEFYDVVVFLPNGARWVFWRGSSYVPFWAGKYNTGLCYEWAERNTNREGFVDCNEPLMDKELRYSRVEIVESSKARIHVRWNYQACDFNYKVNGDFMVEDYYFYPDGFGTRVLKIVCGPEEEYEISEFLILASQSAVPLSFIPFEPIDIISVKTKEKVSVHFPEWYSQVQGYQEWEKISDPSIYRIRSHKDEQVSAISYNPYLTSKPYYFAPNYDNGYLVAPAYWGDHWPLSRGLLTRRGISESIWSNPSVNCPMTWGNHLPKPIKSFIVKTKDSFGIQKDMKIETWAWLIGMTDASDDFLLQLAKSFDTPPLLELSGAKQNSESYAIERRAMSLIVEDKLVSITIKPKGWCVNPVFELQNAPKKLEEVKIGNKTLAVEKYAWDGNTLWLDKIIHQPEMLQLRFNE